MVSGNIKSGVKIFNVTGSLAGGLSSLSYGYTYAYYSYVNVEHDGRKGTVAAVTNGQVSASQYDGFRAISGLPANLKYLLTNTFLWDRENKTTYAFHMDAYNSGKYTTSIADRIYFYKDNPDSYYRSLLLDATFSNGTLTMNKGDFSLSFGIMWFY